MHLRNALLTAWLTREVADAIAKEGRRLHPLETGGVLLGWRDGDNRIVAGVIGPGPEAMHGRTAFLPDHGWQVASIRKAFAVSSGDLDYLGDWHTHPDGAARMSPRDHATLRHIARRVRNPLMLIAAGGPQDWKVAGWTGVGGRLLSRAIPIEQDVIFIERPAKWPSRIAMD